MRLASFIRLYFGRHVQAPGGLGGQCVDLTNLYLLDVVGAELVRANAVDWRHASIRGMSWADNTPANAPTVGCIVVWGPYAPHGIGVNGHIAICCVADAMNVYSFDQNWPDGAPVSGVVHDYGGVLGWWAPSWP